MTTSIGRSLSDSRLRVALATVAAAFVVSLDMTVPLWGGNGYATKRIVAAVLAVVLYMLLTRGDWRALGLAVIPIQGWRYWFKATILLGLVTGGLVLGFLAVVTLVGMHFPLYTLAPANVGAAIGTSCI